MINWMISCFLVFLLYGKRVSGWIIEPSQVSDGCSSLSSPWMGGFSRTDVIPVNISANLSQWCLSTDGAICAPRRACLLSRFSHVWLSATQWTVASPGSPVHADSPSKNTGVGCHVLLQGIFLTQGSNLYLLGLLHWQAAFFIGCFCDEKYSCQLGSLFTEQLYIWF